MSESEPKSSSEIMRGFRASLAAGLLVVVPVGVTIGIVVWLFNTLSGLLRPAINAGLDWLARNHADFKNAHPNWFGPEADIPASIVSIILLFLSVYIIGFIARGMLGRKLITLGEAIVMHIPIIKSIYSATKQVMQAFSIPDRKAFKSVVLVEFPRPGMRCIGFFLGYVHDVRGKQMCKVLIPNSPNPTTGFLEILPADQVEPIDMGVEDALKMIVSGGIVGPEKFGPGTLERGHE